MIELVEQLPTATLGFVWVGLDVIRLNRFSGKPIDNNCCYSAEICFLKLSVVIFEKEALCDRFTQRDLVGWRQLPTFLILFQHNFQVEIEMRREINVLLSIKHNHYISRKMDTTNRKLYLYSKTICPNSQALCYFLHHNFRRL